MITEEKYVRVVQEGGHLSFFDRFVVATGITELIIISPWITDLEFERIKLSQIVYTINKEEVPTMIITRAPQHEPLNIDALKLFEESRWTTIYYNNDLHAKVYVCRCDPFGFALVSSANLSGRATRALEIGVFIEGKGHGCKIIDELALLGKYDIPGRAHTRLYKQRERGTAVY